jgi:hypothetical protein
VHSRQYGGCLICGKLCLAKHCRTIWLSGHVERQGEFNTSWIPTFAAIYDALYHGGVSAFVNRNFGKQYDLTEQAHGTCEGVSKSFRTGRLERELQMVQLSVTRSSCIPIP